MLISLGTSIVELALNHIYSRPKISPWKDITLTRNRVIRFCIQNTYSATYIVLILGTMCCL